MVRQRVNVTDVSANMDVCYCKCPFISSTLNMIYLIMSSEDMRVPGPTLFKWPARTKML